VRPTVRRWLIVAALFTVTYGISTPIAAYGVFLPVLADTFGWTRGAIATALSLNLVLGGLAGFPLGALTDRTGPRVVLVLTVALAGTAFTLVGTVQALWQLYLFVGVLGGIGMSSFYLLSASTVMRWFEQHRGLGLALVLMGFNLGYLSAGPLAAWLITELGWRGAYAALGSGCGLITLLASLTVRLPRAGEAAALHRPVSTSVATGVSHASALTGATLRQALADPRLWCLNFAWLLMGGTSLMLSVHVVPFARDQGVSLAAASLALTAYGLGAVSGRIVAASLENRLGTRNTIRAGYVVQALALLALVGVPSQAVLLPALVVFGVGFGAADTMITKVIPDVFGVRSIGAVMGVLTLGWRFGAALGPASAGFLYDLTGSYGIPFGAAPVAVLVSWGLFTLGASRRMIRAH
jgi:MFS family permease